jgi:hypothetical protein
MAGEVGETGAAVSGENADEAGQLVSILGGCFMKI